MPLPFKKKKPHKTRDGKIGITLRAHDIDTIIDIGANMGQSRDIFRKHGFTGDIISIEPSPALQDTLQKKSLTDPRWKVLTPLALGDKNGECDFNVSEASDLSSALAPSSAMLKALPHAKIVKTVKIPMKTLDSVYEDLNLEGKKVFIKMDTQGYEMPILRASKKTLKSISGLQVEMSLFELYRGETLFSEIIALLDKAGFNPHMIIETTFSRRLNRQLQIDGIFYKD